MKPNFLTDIWKRIDIRDPHECWLFQGSTFSGRYGRYFINGRGVLAHRIVYELTVGKLQEHDFVMHKCNNKMCCNPGHLIAGDNSNNQRHAACSGAFTPGVSGITGVCYERAKHYWVAQVYHQGKRRILYHGPHFLKAKLARENWDTKHGVYLHLELGVQT